MMRKLISGILTAVLLLCGVNAALAANDIGTLHESGMFYYKIKDGKAYISGFEKSDGGELVLPDHIGGAPLVGIEDSYNSKVMQFKSVTLPRTFGEPFPLHHFCPMIEEWKVQEGNPYFDTIDGVLVNKEHTILYSYPLARRDTEYKIPEGITAVYERAFNYSWDNDHVLRSVEFPSTLHYIGEYAFYGQGHLEKIQLPEGFVGAGDYAFYGCKALREAIFPDNMEYIGKEAFCGCGLERVELPENLDRAEVDAFSGNKNLREVVIPASVKHIGENCFGGCHKLVSVSLSESTDIAEDAFKSCTKLIVDEELPTASAADFAGGDGSAENPYLISNENQLRNIEKDLGASYRLINDIELSSGYNYVISEGRRTENGNLTPVFHGTLDGGGYTVSKLNSSIEGSDGVCAGLFGYIRNAEIKNLNVVTKAGGGLSVRLCTGVMYSGGICGYNDGGLIGDCTVSAAFSASSSTGAPTDKYRTASAYAGSIAGYSTGTIRSCCGTAFVEYDPKVLTRDFGGICGKNKGSIESCTARVNQSVKVVYNCIDNNGGIVSENEGTILNCYADGEIKIVVPSYMGPFGYSGARGEACSPKTAGIAVNNSGAVSGCVFNGSICADFVKEFYTDIANYYKSEETIAGFVKSCKKSWLHGICAENTGEITSCAFNAERCAEAQGADVYGTFTDDDAYVDKKALLDALEYSPRLHEIRVRFNGEEIDFDVQPQIIDGRTLVPVRAIFEALGMEVEWDGSAKTVTAVSGENNIIMIIGENSFSANGKAFQLDVPAMIIEGRTLVPVRAIAESTGRTVNWIGEEKLVEIK